MTERQEGIRKASMINDQRQTGGPVRIGRGSHTVQETGRSHPPKRERERERERETFAKRS